jgi:hypothetical protein
MPESRNFPDRRFELFPRIRLRLRGSTLIILLAILAWALAEGPTTERVSRTRTGGRFLGLVVRYESGVGVVKVRQWNYGLCWPALTLAGFALIKLGVAMAVRESASTLD